MANILEAYNHSIQQALANTNNAASLVMETHKAAMQNNTNTLNAINETLRESERNAIEREKNDIASNQAIDNSFQQNSFTRMLAYKDSGMSDKQVQEQMDKDLVAHRAASGYKSNTKYYSLAEMAVGGLAMGAKAGWDKLKSLTQNNKPQENAESNPTPQTQSPKTPNTPNTESTPQTYQAYNDKNDPMTKRMGQSRDISQQINDAYRVDIPQTSGIQGAGVNGSPLSNSTNQSFQHLNLGTLNKGK
ncbi:hypothetical protein [Helicobacter cinaedi]|uniref:hypothetical protein n=1 Tax=Helicobacter cinaedi TaxID=213 RepID=UPI001FB1CF7F|nr:hypothetical protein [Helicobacter cinaedi]